jgi:hypothetical protein
VTAQLIERLTQVATRRRARWPRRRHGLATTGVADGVAPTVA